jgi:transposase-like protein
LEEFARDRIQGWLQDVLEEEVTELLGRGKLERRAVVDAPAGYHNGHGQTRRLAMMAGTIGVKRPRVQGLKQRFESRLLPLFVRRTEAVSELLPQLYLHGLAEGDFGTGVARTAGRKCAPLGLVDRSPAGRAQSGLGD